MAMYFILSEGLAPMAVDKSKSWEPFWSYQLNLPIQSINLRIGPNWPNRQCCSAGSLQRAPRILIFLIAMGADYKFDVKSMESHARPFLPLNNFSCK